MLMTFTKMHGLGNDFVVINNTVSPPISLTPAQIMAMSDRHRGIGCDQILLLEKSSHKNIDFFYRIYNADGSEAGQCGNGARCIGKYIRDKQLSLKDKLRIKTITSILELHIEDQHIRVNMGVPQAVQPFQDGLRLTLGNPHVVFVVPAVKDNMLNNLGLDDYNVSFMQIISRTHIKLRVFERGAGETQACGSGACAAVVAGVTQGFLDHHVTVELRGGNLDIDWQRESHAVWMTGPAETVFEGVYRCN